MKKLPYPDRFHCSAVEGWLMLGNYAEAQADLARLSPGARKHPDVLELEWDVLAHEQRWNEALEVARRLIQVAPERSFGWVHQAFSLRRIEGGGLDRAWEALLPAVKLFPTEKLIPYNLACYAAQLGRAGEAWDWLHRAMEAANDVGLIKKMALADEDLKPLWERIEAL